jgi:hypothetical protein
VAVRRLVAAARMIRDRIAGNFYVASDFISREAWVEFLESIDGIK